MMISFRLSIMAFVLLPASDGRGQTAFKENWDGPMSPWFAYYGFKGSLKPVSGVASTGASDGKALQLTVSPDALPGPSAGPEVETLKPMLNGTFSSRIKTVDCSNQANPSIVTGFFTYFNDGSDLNKDGLPDNSEIDFEWLCSEPQMVHMTMYTDYRDSDGAQNCVTRKVNLATGKIEYSQFRPDFSSKSALTGPENIPAALPALGGYNSSTDFHEYGFSWSETRVTWWIIGPDGEKLILWDYQGPKGRISSRPAYLMLDAFYAPNWSAIAKPPDKPLSAFVDWVGYAPAPSVSNRRAFAPIPSDSRRELRRLRSFRQLLGRR